MHIWLYTVTPKHKANFLKLAKEKFFDQTTFHRVIKTFMIQGGDPYSKNPEKKDSIGSGGPGYTLEAEINDKLFHKRGVLAAARMGDDVNPGRRSSGSQFYIVQGKKFTEVELESARKRIEKALGKPYNFEPQAKEAYMTVGGSPWLDKQYTAFGEVIKGLEVVDKITDVKTSGPPFDRPVEDVKMTMVVKKYSAKKFKKTFGMDASTLP